MDLDAIEQRTRTATEGPWDAAKIAACLHTARTDVPALVARVRELEEALSHAIEFTWPTPKGVIELRHQEPLEPDATYGPWWLNVPWKPLSGGRMENFHDRDDAIARARELTGGKQ